MELVLLDAFSRDVFLIRAETRDDIRESVDAFDRVHGRGHARRHDDGVLDFVSKERKEDSKSSRRFLHVFATAVPQKMIGPLVVTTLAVVVPMVVVAATSLSLFSWEQPPGFVAQRVASVVSKRESAFLSLFRLRIQKYERDDRFFLMHICIN